MALRRDLAFKGLPIGDFFHATEDKQAVRDAVFDLIKQHSSMSVHAQIMEKSKAQMQVRATNERFYQHGWYYLFKNGTAKTIIPGAEVLVTAASVGTKKKQRVFSAAVNDVIQQTVRRKSGQYATSFCPSIGEPCLQIVDYCTWAIQRKWEKGDTRSYDLIKNRIVYEYDLWAHGTKHYY